MAAEAQPEVRVYESALFARIWIFVRPHWRIFAIAVALLPVSSILQLLPPYLIKRVVDDAIVAEKTELILPMTIPLVIVLVAQYLIGFTHSFLIQLVGHLSTRDLRIAAHRHLLSLGTRFFDRSPVGALVTRITNDIESISEAFAGGIIAAIADMVVLVGIVVAMFLLHARLAALTLTTLPLLILVVSLFQRLLRKRYREIRKRLARINATLQEHVNGIKVIQVFSKEEQSQEKFDDVNRSYRDAYKEAIRLDAMLFSLVELIGSLTLVLILWYCSRRLLDNTVTFGLIVAFIQYVQRFFEPIRDMSSKYAVMQQAMAASERVFDLLDTDDLDGIVTSNEATSFGEQDTQNTLLEFKNVTFDYGTGKNIFDGLSFRLESQERIAIVGTTGSGKSTIARLLIRLYDVADGTILLNGRNIRSLPVHELRKQVAMLSQDVFLFSGDVRDNISLGDPAITEQAVEDAAQRVGLFAFLRLDHHVAERGANLSQGQRQLVAFARALARDPEILILDEATSNIDPQTERAIELGIAELMRRRAAIVIAHRLSTIEQVDRIIVLDNGSIAESGTHKFLLERAGIYAQLRNLQVVDDASARSL